MRNSIFKLLGMFAVLAVFLAGCGADSTPAGVVEISHYRHSPVFVGATGGGSGVDLVNEADERLRVAKSWVNDVTIALSAALTHGNVLLGHCQREAWDQFGTRVDDSRWHSDRVLSIDVGLNDSSYQVDCDGDDIDGPPGWLGYTFTFGSGINVDGKVNTYNCRALPGGGTKTSGEYSKVANNSKDPISQHLKHAVEESKSSETSLDETVDLTTGLTVEAGASFPGGEAKATASVESHFGLSKGSLDAQSTTTTREVELEVTIRPGQILGVAYTTDDSATDCDRDIDTTVDWTSIDIDIYRHDCGSECEDSGFGHLEDHMAISSHDHTVRLSFSQADDVLRLLSGTLDICDGCQFNRTSSQFGDSASDANKRLADPARYRHLVYSGTERTVQKDSASYVVQDITGADPDCVAENFGKEGNDIGVLDDC